MTKDYEGLEISIYADHESERIMVIAPKYEKIKIFHQISWQGVPTVEEIEIVITELLSEHLTKTEIDNEIEDFRDSELFNVLNNWHLDN